MGRGNKGLFVLVFVLLIVVFMNSTLGKITGEKIEGPNTARENVSVTFTCSATCQAGCSYSWNIGSTKLGSSGNLTTTLQRSNSALILACTISSNGTSRTITHSVNVLYGPDSIKAPANFTLTENDPTSTAKPIVCQAISCNPTCDVTWKKGNDVIVTNQSDSLTWVGSPTSTLINRTQAGTYTCSVKNRNISSTNVLEKTTKIIVQYPPDVVLNWDNATFKFTCTADGNPNVYTFSLKQYVNSKLVKNHPLSRSGGTAVSEKLGNNYKTTGLYKCQVINSVGLKTAIKDISIEDRPVSVDWENGHNVSKGHPLVLTAKIYAIPNIKINNVVIFHNNASDSIDITKNVTVYITSDQCSVDFGVNVQTSCQKVHIRFEKMAEEFFGRIQVRISNTKGIELLEGDINPEGPPDVPVDFHVRDLEHESVKFVLKSGFFNGASQTFVVEIRRADNSSGWSNVSTVFVGPKKGVVKEIMVPGLSPETRYKARAYASNIFDRSAYTEPVYLTTREEPMNAGAIAGIVIGLLVVLVLLLIAGYFVFRWRRKPKEAPKMSSRVHMPEIIDRESAVLYQNTEIRTFSGSPLGEGIYVNQLVSTDEAVVDGLSPTKQEEGIYVNMGGKKAAESEGSNIPLYLDIQAANDASSNSDTPYMNISQTELSPGESDYLDMDVNNRKKSNQNNIKDYQNVSHLKKNGPPPKKSSKEETVSYTQDRNSIPQYVAPLPPPGAQSPGSEKAYMNIQFS